MKYNFENKFQITFESFVKNKQGKSITGSEITGQAVATTHPNQMFNCERIKFTEASTATIVRSLANEITEGDIKPEKTPHVIKDHFIKLYNYQIARPLRDIITRYGQKDKNNFIQAFLDAEKTNFDEKGDRIRSDKAVIQTINPFDGVLYKFLMEYLEYKVPEISNQVEVVEGGRSRKRLTKNKSKKSIRARSRTQKRK